MQQWELIWTGGQQGRGQGWLLSNNTGYAPQRQVCFIGYAIILHFRVNGASPALLVLWLVLLELGSGLVWLLGEYDEICWGFRDFKLANIVSKVIFPWGLKIEDSNKNKAQKHQGKHKECSAHSQAHMKTPYHMKWPCQIFLLGSEKSIWFGCLVLFLAGKHLLYFQLGV